MSCRGDMHHTEMMQDEAKERRTHSWSCQCACQIQWQGDQQLLFFFFLEHKSISISTQTHTHRCYLPNLLSEFISMTKAEHLQIRYRQASAASVNWYVGTVKPCLHRSSIFDYACLPHTHLTAPIQLHFDLSCLHSPGYTCVIKCTLKRSQRRIFKLLVFFFFLCVVI